MNKSELAASVAGTASLDRRSAEKAVDAVFKVVMGEVEAGNKVTVLGFGSFAPAQRAARTARNPRTGEAVAVPASKTVRFSPGSAFKESLNRPKPSARSARR
ncbi:MAG: HU family DNA-binding protein [Acidimicrobiales bacterium]